LSNGGSLLGSPTFSGSVLALVFWWQALTPTMIPRTWQVQAAISALCLAIAAVARVVTGV